MLRFGQESQVARYGILIEVMHPFAHTLEREAERETGAERVAVGLDVTDHHERRAAAEFADHFLRRRIASFALDHSSLAFTGACRSASSRRVLASAIARSVERSSMNTSSGVCRKSIRCPSSPRRKRAALCRASSDLRATCRSPMIDT